MFGRNIIRLGLVVSADIAFIMTLLVCIALWWRASKNLGRMPERTLEEGLNPATQDNSSNYLYYVGKTNAGHGYDGIV